MSPKTGRNSRVVRLYLEDGKPGREIADIVGCSYTTVYRILAAEEVPLRHRGGRTRPRTSVMSDPDVVIRTLEPTEVAAAVNAVSRDLATNPVLSWLRPHGGDHHDIMRTHLRDLSAQPDKVATRVACRDDNILAAAWWTTCTGPGHPHIDLIIPGPGRSLTRRALLHSQLTARHPADPHHHLLAIATTRTHRRRGIGTALITDTGLHHGTWPRYLVLPGTGAPPARCIGFQPAATVLILTNTLTLHPWWIPAGQLHDQSAIDAPGTAR